VRVAVLISGEGTNLQALLDTVHGRDGIEIVAVAASRAEARGLARAEAAGVEKAVFALADQPDRALRDEALGDWLEGRGARLVVLAGFMELLSGGFIRRFPGRIVNVHPSLLPAFPGVRPIEQALEYGVKLMGVTVHFVDEGVDSGAIILQEAFENFPYSRDIAAIENRIHEIEHRLLPQAVRLIAAGAVRVDPASPRHVIVEEAGHGDD
jgi:phosphoribosylglycinamide formyltransferase 1